LFIVQQAAYNTTGGGKVRISSGWGS